ncbi:hypothetical protein HDU98_002194, partial [Podochytrium sp. JEL0797]
KDAPLSDGARESAAFSESSGWMECNATESEADIKADRGEITFKLTPQQQQQQEKK